MRFVHSWDCKRLVLAGLIATTLVPPAACASSLKRFEYSQLAMGVRARIVVYAETESKARTACKAAFERINRLEDIMSDYRQESELARVCKAAGGSGVSVSPELLWVLGISRELARRSGGAFDPTVAPLVRLWRKARQTGELPSQREIAEAKKLVGWQKLVLDTRNGTVRLKQPGMMLDLGGIAKGYACDEALRVLREHGICIALVEMGGDVVVGEPPPGKLGWEVEIGSADGRKERLQIANLAISTSGDTEQFVEIAGRRYSHIVDPRTGCGLSDRIMVTVATRYGVISDGLSTAIRVLGEKRGRTLAATYGVKWLRIHKMDA